MRLTIAGIGVVTPLGHDVLDVARRIALGERGTRVGSFDILEFTPSERLRRAPPVSLFAVAAAARAFESDGRSSVGGSPEGGMRTRELDPARVGVIAAVAKGAMIYSARFHSQFVGGGAKALVPLLFPETVANAPASHVASVLGLRGPNATILGDAAASFNAIAMARDWLEWGLADGVLVVAPHEFAQIMADGYARFRWIFRGAPFSEGAAALLLTREGTGASEITHVDRGFPFRRRNEIPSCLERALHGLPLPPEVVSVSGGETVHFGSARRVSIKEALGEAFTAGALWQIIFGLVAAEPGQTVLATCVGLNEQVSAILAKR